jgi:AcrR family transcriptional regulator
MMTHKQVREPQQSRSINMKEKILETALTLFSEKGYYQTSTNEIAKTAGVSIGSLYSYFQDKDTIFLKIVSRNHQLYSALTAELLSKPELYEADKQAWLRSLIENLVNIHQASKGLYRQISILYHANPAVTAIIDKQNKESRENTIRFFNVWQAELKMKDPEATGIIAFDFISAIVDEIVFGKSNIAKERLIETGVAALTRLLTE